MFFNFFKMGLSSGRSITGPVAAAMSEIMAWYLWPEHGTFPRYTTNTPSPVNVTANYTLTVPQRAILRSNYMTSISGDTTVRNYVANLIVETGYRLNSSFGAIATIADPADAVDVFVEMGYAPSPVLGTYSYSTLKSEINPNQRPVIMYGTGSSLLFVYTTYAYVIYGYKLETINNIVEDYLFLVDGMIDGDPGFGNPNGSYFHEKIFSTNGNPNSYSLPAGTVFFPYRYNCKTITNIKKGSKTGSIDPSWRVRTTNAY